MEDVTDTVFRQIIARYAPPDVFFTEFVNVDGMCSPGRDAVIHRLRHSGLEHPIVAQIWGLKPEHFERSARDIREMGFDGIDLNMGCSVKKVLKTGACAKLIENPGLADEMIQAAKEGAADTPVSVKTRMGFSVVKTEEWCGFLLEHGLAALTVHGRTARQTYDVPADWDEIAKVAALRDSMQVNTVIIGNGDVSNAGEIPALCRSFNVDGVMIGRGVLRDPLVFEKSDETSFSNLSPGQKAAMLKEHLTLYVQTWQSQKNPHVLKKFVKTYLSNFSGATEMRRDLLASNSVDEMLKIIDTCIEEQ